MEDIQAMQPIELVYLDYLTIEMIEGGKDVHISIITNLSYGMFRPWWHCHRLLGTQFKPFGKKFIVCYGLPKSIVFDQIWNFEIDFIAELCKMAKVKTVYQSLSSTN